MKKLTSSGFSMIEVTIVLAIAGILGSVALPNFKAMQDRSAVVMAKGQMAQITVSVDMIHTNRQTLAQAGTDCTGCGQGWVAHSDPNTWPGVESGVGLSSWRALGFQEVPKDPWGHYYVLDENDAEFKQPYPNQNISYDFRYDAVWSGGPDGIWEGPGDGDDVYGDDLIWRLPMLNPARCPAARMNESEQFGASRCLDQRHGG